MVVFKSYLRVILPTSDVNIACERHINAVSHNKTPISVAHAHPRILLGVAKEMTAVFLNRLE